MSKSVGAGKKCQVPRLFRLAQVAAATWEGQRKGAEEGCGDGSAGDSGVVGST